MGPEMADAKEKNLITTKDISISRCTCRITKIISGGQTGAARTSPDVVIEKGIAHGGSIPKVRLTETRVLPEKYQLMEMETTSYSTRMEQNVTDPDGTLNVSYGKLTGRSSTTRKIQKNSVNIGSISTLTSCRNHTGNASNFHLPQLTRGQNDSKRRSATNDSRKRAAQVVQLPSDISRRHVDRHQAIHSSL